MTAGWNPHAHVIFDEHRQPVLRGPVWHDGMREAVLQQLYVRVNAA
jgi:hypothetical protein